MDQYSSGGDYLALTTRDLSRPETFRRLDPATIDYGVSRKRHGSILNISRDELQRLRAKWPTPSTP